MEVTALCFRLLMLEFILLGTQVQNHYTQRSDAAFLRIIPNRLQHFEYEPVSFHCDGHDSSTQLRGILNTGEFIPACNIKRISSGSTCTIDKAYTVDSGEYWCETKGGDRSNSVNISVIAGSVILESPAVPVMEGDSVTLRCRSKTTSTKTAVFYKDGVQKDHSPAAEMRLDNVSKSDEGLYKCSIQGSGESPESRLAVRASIVSITSPPPHKESVTSDGGSPEVLILLWFAVSMLMMALVLLGVRFLHFRKHRVSSKTPAAAASHPGGDHQTDDADDENGVMYAVVVTKQRKDRDAVDAGDNLSLCIETNHSRKPQTKDDEEESSHELVYSAVTITKTPRALQPGHDDQRHVTEDEGRD